MALRQLSLPYYNSLVISVSYCSVIAIGVDVVIVVVVVVIVNFRCPPVSSVMLLANYGFFLTEYRLLEPRNLFNAVAMHAP